MWRPYVAVIGAADASALELERAEAVGRALAEREAVLICGGLGGVMEAACRGARACDGITVGLLPGFDRAGANPHLVVALPTGLGELRNGLIVRAADAVIAIGGGSGTLSEIGFALRIGRPVIGLGTWRLQAPSPGADALIEVSTADEAARIALSEHPGCENPSSD